jgi:UDP-N-acetylglucosamine 2-epimerase
MTKNKFTIDLNENNNDSSTDEELTVSKTKKQELQPHLEDETDIQQQTEPKKRMNKSGKPRAPYVLTDKRKQQFELARQVRMKNIEEAKAKQNENYSQYNDLKKELEKKKIKKLEKIKKKELVKLMAETENISSDDSSIDEPPIDKPPIIIKKRTKSKKPIVVESETESSSESSSEEDVKPIKKATKKKTTTTTKKKPIQPIQKEKPEFITPSFGIRYI